MQTQFGTVEFGDKKSIEDFLARHNQAHLDLAQNLSRLGVSIPVPPLTGPITDEWLTAHKQVHSATDQALQVPGSVGLDSSVRLLAEPQAFYTWLMLNDLDHQQYLQASGGG